MNRFFVLILLAALTATACSGSKKEQVKDDVQSTEQSLKEDAVDAAEKTAEAVATVDIFDTLIKTGKHATLIAAIEAAGLKDTLKSGGPFTLFAPDDEAFKKVPADQLAKLLTEEGKEDLSKILTLHVVPGKVLSSEVTTADVPTVNGQTVPVVVNAETKAVTFGAANVTGVDHEATNGVVHVIDAVILPTAG